MVVYLYRSRRDSMAKMTRGEISDLVSKFAVENPKYREALIKDPKMILEKQLNTKFGNIKVKTVTETADTMFLVIPYVAAEGELGDADLQKVAGGVGDSFDVECGEGTMNTLVQLGL
jgi:hypothetical protein